jgi:hypothetical protein
VTANEPAGNGSVKTAPETQQEFNNWCPGSKTWSNLDSAGCSGRTDTPISAMSQLTSTYAESFSHDSKTIAQWAWDNWLDNDGGYSNEVMVWTDVVGRCNSGSYGNPVHAPVTIDGRSGSRTSTRQQGIYLGVGWRQLVQPAGVCTVDLLGLLKWMQANGYASDSALLSLVDGVFAICSTGGGPEKFSVFSYSLSAAR